MGKAIIRLILIAVALIVASCATAPKTAPPSTLRELPPDTVRCLGMALNSGAYDEPPPECR